MDKKSLIISFFPQNLSLSVYCQPFRLFLMSPSVLDRSITTFPLNFNTNILLNILDIPFPFTWPSYCNNLEFQYLYKHLILSFLFFPQYFFQISYSLHGFCFFSPCKAHVLVLYFYISLKYILKIVVLNCFWI
jgi:hypothetical protein